MIHYGKFYNKPLRRVDEKGLKFVRTSDKKGLEIIIISSEEALKIVKTKVIVRDERERFSSSILTNIQGNWLLAS